MYCNDKIKAVFYDTSSSSASKAQVLDYEMIVK